MAELTSLIKRGANYINKIRNNEFVSSLKKLRACFWYLNSYLEELWMLKNLDLL